MGNAMIGVVIINHNYGKWISQAIKSVQAQTIPVEMVVVDGKSTDGSQYIAESLGATVIIDRPGSIGHARNQGIRELAECDVIIPLDSDDWIEPTYAEKCSAKLSEGFDVVATGMKYHWEGIDDCAEPGQWIPRGGVQWPDFPITYDRLRSANRMFCCSMFRREIWEKVNGYPTYPTHADWEMWIKISQAGGRFAMVGEALFNYRLHTGSGMVTCPDGKFKSDISQRYA